MPFPLELYATGEDLIKRYDIDLVADLCQDSRAELDYESDITNLTEHPNVVSAIEDASGEIDTALTVGGRYTPAQLHELFDPTPGQVAWENTRKHLIRVTCAIAMSILVERRLDRVSQETADWLRKNSDKFLKQLKRGENVFGIQEVVDTGAIDFQTVQAIEVERLNLLPARMPRFFPPTEQRTPRNRD